MANLYDALQQPQKPPAPPGQPADLYGALTRPPMPAAGAAPAGTAPPAGVPAPVPGRVQAPPLQATPQAPPAPATPAPEGMSDQDWTNFQARYPQPGTTPQAGPAAIQGTANGTGGGPPPNPMTDAFRQALTQRLQATTMPTSIADDPTLTAQSGAFRQANARAAARNRSNAVEAAGAAGLGRSGAVDGMTRAIEADRALKEGQFDANLLGDARKERMGELFQALGLAGNYDLQDRGLAEQIAGRLAGQDIQRQGLTLQGDLGRGDLALRDRLGTRGADNQLLDILLGDRYRNTSLGLNAGLAEQGINTNALLGLMGMGG